MFDVCSYRENKNPDGFNSMFNGINHISSSLDYFLVLMMMMMMMIPIRIILKIKFYKKIFFLE